VEKSLFAGILPALLMQKPLSLLSPFHFCREKNLSNEKHARLFSTAISFHSLSLIKKSGSDSVYNLEII
jgi:hypothetical protein